MGLTEMQSLRRRPGAGVRVGGHAGEQGPLPARPAVGEEPGGCRPGGRRSRALFPGVCALKSALSSSAASQAGAGGVGGLPAEDKARSGPCRA